MRQKNQYYRILFLLSVFLLLLNDFILKKQFHNYFTGKLSDFAGLFALPYFLCLLFPKNSKFNYILSGVLFIIWKSEIIEPLLHFLQSMGIGVNCTVDYSDLMALIVLPFSYKYWHSESKQLINTNRNLKPAIIGVCCFSFIATTLPHEEVKLNLKANLEIKLKATKETVISNLDLRLKEDNKYYSNFNVPDKRSEVISLVILEELDGELINIKLDSIVECITRGSFFSDDNEDAKYIKNLKVEDFEKLYLEEKIIKGLYREKD